MEALTKMASIHSIDIISTMLQNNGIFPGDPGALEINQYETAWGDTCYHVAYTHADVLSLQISPAVGNIVLLWSRQQGLTNRGRELLLRQGKGDKGSKESGG